MLRCPGVQSGWSVAIAVIFVAAATVSAVGAQDESAGTPAATGDQLREAIQKASRMVEPAVVQIQTVGGKAVRGEVDVTSAATTGLVVDDDGWILTSVFNFSSQPAGVFVTFSDGQRMNAEIVASDLINMVTLLRVDAQNLPVAEYADAEEENIGQWTIAVGKGYSAKAPNLSVGVLSAVGRFQGLAAQTDARISPVNYGGPLVDLNGRVLGLLVPLSPRGQDIRSGVEWYDSGIGFAIPSRRFPTILSRLKDGEDRQRGQLGIALKGANPLSKETIIARVVAGSPAALAGLAVDDRIVSVNGQVMERTARFTGIMRRTAAGDELQLVLKRGADEISTSVVAVAEIPSPKPPFLGIAVRQPDAEEQKSLAGLPITAVLPETPASEVGMRSGDQLASLNGRKIESLRDLQRALLAQAAGDALNLKWQPADRKAAEKSASVALAEWPTGIFDVSSELLPELLPGPRDTAEAPSLVPGRGQEQLGEQGSFWYFAPRSIETKAPHGVLFWVDDGSQSREAELVSRWQSVCESHQLILVCPLIGNGDRLTSSDGEFLEQILFRLRDSAIIDGTRVVLHAEGQETATALELLAGAAGLIRGAVLIDVEIPIPFPEGFSSVRLPVCVVRSATDQSSEILVIRRIEELREKGIPVSELLAPAVSGRYPSAEAVREMADWTILIKCH